jgi:hypothetical protein
MTLFLSLPGCRVSVEGFRELGLEGCYLGCRGSRVLGLGLTPTPYLWGKGIAVVILGAAHAVAGASRGRATIAERNVGGGP